MPVSFDLDKVLDKQYENAPLDQVLAAPVAGLQGLTGKHGEALSALGITTIGDLGRNKYVRWAVALADLHDRAH
ncbi:MULTISPECIES: hypothetical protein [unclassified Streptomyces]|uniref:hypothetical protein n=1 Tax=unclassified Streptomyces TaxID=2593676 RepID=UPI0034398F3B